MLDPIIQVAQAIAFDSVRRPSQYRALPEKLAVVLQDLRVRTGSQPEWPGSAQRAQVFASLFGETFRTLGLDLRSAGRTFAECAAGANSELLEDRVRDAAVGFRGYLRGLEGRAVAVADGETGPVFRSAVEVLRNEAVAGVFGLPPAPGGDWPLDDPTRTETGSPEAAFLIEALQRTVGSSAQGPLLTQHLFLLLQRLAHYGAMTIGAVLEDSASWNGKDGVQKLARVAYGWDCAHRASSSYLEDQSRALQPRMISRASLDDEVLKSLPTEEEARKFGALFAPGGGGGGGGYTPTCHVGFTFWCENPTGGTPASTASRSAATRGRPAIMGSRSSVTPGPRAPTGGRSFAMTIPIKNDASPRGMIVDGRPNAAPFPAGADPDHPAATQAVGPDREPRPAAIGLGGAPGSPAPGRERPLPEGYVTAQAGIWFSVTGPVRAADRLQQGWKLHLSARPESLGETVGRALPVLLEAGCDFKVIADAELLRDVNAGLYGAGTVGKAITVYPDQDGVVRLAHRLADALRGLDGPRISSDRRLRPDAPVYYRFGPISPRLRMNEAGRLDVMVEAPDGRLTSGLAGITDSSPDWAEDPFRGGKAVAEQLPRIDGAPVIGDHYKVVGAIVRTYRGSSYRAIDLRSGRRVVVKESRAFVNETREGDTRAYLRNERRVLHVLKGIPGVPQVVDHFAYGDDEFLVTTELGPANLRDDIIDTGPFAWWSGSPRNVLDLARGLLRILDDVHRRGVVYRDLAPKNVVARADGGWDLVDFELSRFAETQCFGWSPGYSEPRQRRNEPASVEDDYYSLGGTIFHAVTGLDPIIIDPDPETNAARTLDCLIAICGAEAPVVAIVRALLDPDPGVRARAARELRETTDLESGPPPTASRRSPPLGPVFRHTLDAVLGSTAAILADDAWRRGPPPRSLRMRRSLGSSWSWPNIPARSPPRPSWRGSWP